MGAHSWHRQVGQLAIVGFAGTSVSPELRALTRDFDVGGVILFARNIESPDQIGELAHDVQMLSRDVPMWIAIDQEGGRVARLTSPFTEWPPMAALGRCGSEDLARRFAKALASELKAVGVSLDFAPVLDVHTNPKNPVIGDRALAERPEQVAKLGAAIIETLQAEGVAACGKHFPGHGDTSTDSHHELPIVEHPPERLRETELMPFRAAVRAKVASIMTAHVLLPAFDEARPASLSRPIVTDLLRGELRFEGLIICDDLQMKGCAATFTVPDAAVAAVAAGSDAVLICGPDHHEQHAALEALVHAVEQEMLPRSAIEDAAKRHVDAKSRFITPGFRPLAGAELAARIGTDRHRRIAEEMRRC